VKKIVITGAGGFIGRALVNKLSENKKNLIIALDNNERGSLKKIKNKKNITKLKIDVTNKKKLEKIFKGVDECYHLAAINGTKNFYEKPARVLKIGVLGTEYALNACIKNKVKLFVFFSSSEAYQTPLNIPTKENEILKVPDVFNPRLSYGGSKIIGELLTINYLKNTKINFKILRPHNVYGPDMGNDHVLPELIKKIYNKLKFKDKNLKINIFGSGDESRSFIYIDDAVNAILKVAYKGAKNAIFNIGSNDEITIKKLIIKLGKILKIKILIKKNKLHQGSVTRRCPNVSKLKKLGHKNKINLNQGLYKTILFYKKIKSE